MRPSLVCCFLLAAIVVQTFQTTQLPFIGPTHAPIPAPYTTCRILINELELLSSDGKQFIELKKYCLPQPRNHNPITLATYKLVIVNYEGYMVMICHLDGYLQNRPKSKSHRVSHSYFYIIGTENTENVDFNINKCQIAKEYNLKVPLDDSYPFGAALIRSESKPTMRLITLEGEHGLNYRYIKTRMLSTHVKAIQESLQDFVIYGSNTPFVVCSVFTELYGKYTANPKLILRDWNSPSSVSRSINRCGDSVEPFWPAAMKLSKRSPGFENDCINGEEFFIEEKVTQLNDAATVDFGYGNQCKVLSKYTENKNNFPTDDVLNSLFNEDQLNDDEIPVCEYEEINFEEDENNNEDEIIEIDAIENDPELIDPDDINRYQIFIPQLVNDKSYFTENCDNFDINWIGSLQQEVQIDKVRQPDVCNWFDYIRGIDSKATCRFCHALHRANLLVERFSSPYSSKFIKSKHWHSTGERRKRQNAIIIEKHLENPLHDISLQYFKHLDNGLRGKSFEKAMLARTGNLYRFHEATINLVIAVHSAVHMGLPFSGFKEYTDTLKYYGVNIGNYHLSAAGYRRMLNVISDSMHSELLHHLRSTQPKLGIILDESVDVAGYSNYAFILQTFDSNNRVTTYHYYLSSMVKRNKGIYVFDLFKNQLISDGISEYFKANVVALIADGSKVLQSVFYQNLQQFTKKSVIKIHCASHRLELAYKASFQKFKNIRQVDKIVNALARFFNHQSSKRKLVLRSKTLEAKKRNFELHRIHPIRWVSSRKRAYGGLLEHWKIVVQAIEEIALSSDFKDDHSTVDLFLDQLKKPSFLTHLAFLKDVTDEITRVSLFTQKKNGNFIELFKLKEEMILNIETFAFDGGKELQKLIGATRSSDEEVDSSEKQFKDLFKFETTINAYCGISLSIPDPTEDEDTLSAQILDYTLNLVSEIRKRFPDNDVTNQFDVFDPKNFAELQQGELHYGQTKMTIINNAYKFYTDEFALHLEWKLLIGSIVRHRQFDIYKTKDPAIFWQLFLDCSEISWTNSLKTIIYSILVVSPSSSEAEREFSLQNAIKTKKRYNLDVSAVDATIRVKMNSERDLKRVNALTYARQFALKYRRPDDEHLPRIKPKQSTDEYDFLGTRLKTIFETRHEI